MINKQWYPNGREAVPPIRYDESKTRVNGAGVIVGDCHPNGWMWRSAKAAYESNDDGEGKGCGMVTGLCRSNGIGEG